MTEAEVELVVSPGGGTDVAASAGVPPKVTTTTTGAEGGGEVAPSGVVPTTEGAAAAKVAAAASTATAPMPALQFWVIFISLLLILFLVGLDGTIVVTGMWRRWRAPAMRLLCAQ